MKVILVGIGGATCSGKTTLARHLHRILPDSVVVHQDDFATPLDQLPVHPVHKVTDWDAAPTAIQWGPFIQFLRNIKLTGATTAEHHSSSYFNEKDEIGVDPRVSMKWTGEFEKIRRRTSVGHERVLWVIVDGFLLFWHKEVLDLLDVRIMLRVPENILKQRRLARPDWCTADGTPWPDPPGYWEAIVYPAYLDAHRGVFEDDDVENGRLTGKIDGLVVLDSTVLSMENAVEECCRILLLQRTSAGVDKKEESKIVARL